MCVLEDTEKIRYFFQTTDKPALVYFDCILEQGK